MTSPLHVFEPVRPISWNVLPYGLPVDRGPFTWDRTGDGKLDEGVSAPRVMPKGRGYGKRSATYGVLAGLIKQAVMDLAPGTGFTQRDIQVLCGQGFTLRQFKDTFSYVRPWMLDGVAAATACRRYVRL